MEPNDGKPDMVVTLDAEIPDPHITLAMTLSRVGDSGGMSHLLELRFAQAARSCRSAESPKSRTSP